MVTEMLLNRIDVSFSYLSRPFSHGHLTELYRPFREYYTSTYVRQNVNITAFKRNYNALTKLPKRFLITTISQGFI